MSDTRSCIVVGAGLLGLSSAWALTRRGWRVTVLEAGGAVGHERAGSKGDARIFRLGYREPIYAEMALLARSRWRDLEEASGQQLLRVSEQVTFGDGAAVDAIAGALRAVGAPVEPLSLHEAARRFPGIAVSGSVLVEPDSGVLAADACLRALIETGGFALHCATTVTSLSQQPDFVSVGTTDGQTRRADIVIDCAGPASLGLLDVSTETETIPSLPQVAYFAPRHSDTMPPVFIEWGHDMLYGLPVPAGGTHAGTYKISHHTRGEELAAFDPSDPLPLGTDDPALLARLTDGVARLLPSLRPQPVATERCVYDNAGDSDFVLDRVGRIVVGCGTSGHAFKFGPLLGELLADLAEGRRAPVDMERFSLWRSPAAPGGEAAVPR